MKDKEIARLKSKIEKMEVANDRLRAKLEGTEPKASSKPAAKRSTTKKTAVKKATVTTADPAEQDVETK